VKEIKNKAMRQAVAALLQAKQMEAEAKDIKAQARAEIEHLLDKAGLPVNEEERQAKALVCGVEVTVSYVPGRTTIDADGLRDRYPRIAKQFTKQGRPFTKIDAKVRDAEEAADILAA
jgi:hypothetical protein